jgi:conjugative relaxase-like TrwC/TraI family protein
MLSIGRLGVNGGADYYLDKVANNVDDYYLGRGEAPGQWIGSASEQFGLSGQVDPDSLRNLLAGLSADGQSLGMRLRSDRRPGYDLTFSAPKGVSLLWAFGPDAVRGAISVAHDSAVSAALNQLSTEACYARRGDGGHQLIQANGYLGAAFRHRTSRAGDPQLHTHVVVPNLVQGTDGTCSAPDGRHLFTWAKTAGTLYQSALRAELAPLGLAWDVRRSGLGELAGIQKSILRAFSTRRADIEAAMETRGLDSHRTARTVTLATRSRKPNGSLVDDVLREHWREQLSGIELPDGSGARRPAAIDDLTGALGMELSVPLGPDDIEAVFRILLGEHGVSLDEWEIDESRVVETNAPGTRAMPVTLLGSTFTRRDALSAVARAFDITPEEAVALTAELLERDSVVRVLADPEVEADRIRTKSGHVVSATSGDRRYTTTELLAAEQRVTRSAVARIGEGTGRVGSNIVDQVLSLHGHLDAEQAEGVRALLTSGNGYDLVIGQAGTGKSTMLGAARVGWEAAGNKVIGAAVAARTAADLEAGTGIPSSSLTQLLADLREAGGLTSRHVIVVDEASMVGTRSLDKLRSHVEMSAAKLVLVGDNRQLSSIDAGGALRTLSKELGDRVVTLTTNRRQVGDYQQWERDALVDLRDGNVAPAVHAYVENGRVTIAATLDEARHRLVADWWAVHHDHTTAILAVRRADVVALNDLVRARRRAGGELGEEIVLGDKTFSVGDRVLFEKNQRVREAGHAESGASHHTVRIRNGTFATVVGVLGSPGSGPDGNPVTREDDVTLSRGDVAQSQGDVARTSQGDVAEADLLRAPVHEPAALVVELDDGRRAVLPHAYAKESTSLGYALTVFRSQGITVDHTFGLGGDSLFQEAGYTQLSRGRLCNNLYVTAPENPRWEIGHRAGDTKKRDALQSLVDALSQTREQTMAQDRLPIWTALAPDELDATYRQHATLARWLSDHAPEDVTEQLAVAVEGTAVERPAFEGEGIEGIRGIRAVGRESHPEPRDLATLAAAQRHRNAWIARHQEEITTWYDLEGTIRRHEYRLGQAAAYSRPEHVTDLLGSLPHRVSDVERWQRAAGAIESYRSRWNVSSEGVLGPEPISPDQAAHWNQTVATVDSAGSINRSDTPESGSDHESLATRWETIQDVDLQRHNDRRLERSPVPPPEPLWPDEPDLDQDLGYGLGL